MKTTSVFVIATGIMSVLFGLASFINLRNEKAIKTLKTEKTSKGFAVLELFTSEGCSSCPPADELVEKIQKNNENKEIYLLAFHVDYWDHQGWKDKFSNPEFSARQRQYANWLKLRIVYTPQIVINGTKEQVGSDQGPILKAISSGLGQASSTKLTLEGKLTEGQVNIAYQVRGSDKDSELVLALVQKSAKSNVRAGENEGKKLSHVQIVRQLRQVDLNDKDLNPENKTGNTFMHLPEDFKAQGWELIGFIQRKTDGRITSAARIDFRNENMEKNQKL